MNLSLKNRIAVSFIIVTAMVLTLGFTVFFFLNNLNQEIEQITDNSKKAYDLTFDVRIQTVSLLKTQRKILTQKAISEDLRNLVVTCENIQSQLQQLDVFYSDVEIKKIIAKLLGYVDSLKTIVSKTSLQARDGASFSTISDLADKILDTFSNFQDIQRIQLEERDRQVQKIIEETKRNMLITLIITFLFTILLTLVIPGKIALPFKKINDAIRELQECNFDVSIYYDQDDEIGELSREINKMISSMKTFDELRANRIQMEHRKFDALANMLKKMVLISNAKGELIYLNNSLYSLLDFQTDDVLNKSIADTLISDSIVETMDLAIKRRSKIENAEITIFDHHHTEQDETGYHEPEERKLIFKGFATVIPIRGKDSSSDYYLMILSEEVFS
ncbi:MAG: PAS domain-containing protein [Bacteriovoracaceae bacterium]|nr:PAS domain-containing protein [Bacteriovoracaceae bacterium]